MIFIQVLVWFDMQDKILLGKNIVVKKCGYNLSCMGHEVIVSTEVL